MTTKQASELLLDLAGIIIDETEKTFADWGMGTLDVMTSGWFLSLIPAPGQAFNILVDRLDVLFTAIAALPANIAQRAMADIAATVTFHGLSTRVVRADRAAQMVTDSLLVYGPQVLLAQRGVFASLMVRWKSRAGLFKVIFHPSLDNLLAYAIKKLFSFCLLRWFVNLALFAQSAGKVVALVLLAIVASDFLARVASGEIQALALSQDAPRKPVSSEEGVILRREPGGVDP